MFKHGFPPEWSTFKKLIWLVGSGIAGAASGIWKTVTGTLIHITDALASPVKELSVAIEPQQSGSGDPSPDNVRPITGWTGANVNAGNKNLMVLDTPYKIGALSYSTNVGGTFAPGTTSEGTYSFENDIATLHNNNAWRGVAIASKPLAAGTYRFGFKILSREGSGNSDAVDVLILDKNYTILEKKLHGSSISTGNHEYNITLDQDGCYVALDVGGRSSTYVTVKISNIQLEIGQTTTEYQRPNTTTYHISWQTEAGTVYGGTLDMVSGALTSELKAMHFSDLTWSENANFTDIFNGDGFIDRKRRIDGSNANGCYCDSYQWAKSDKLDKTTNGIALGNTTSAQTRTRIYVKDQRFSSPQEFVASFATYDPLVICPLATEDEYSLTPTTVNTLSGENNIWADVNGEITLTYKSNGNDSDIVGTGKADFMKLLS